MKLSLYKVLKFLFWRSKTNNMARPRKTVKPSTENVETVTTPTTVTKDKAYFKSKLEELSDEMAEAIKADRSLSIRLKSIQGNLRRDSRKL